MARTVPGRVATLILPANTAWEDADGPAPALPMQPRQPVSEEAVSNAAQVLRSDDSAVLLCTGLALRGPTLEIASRMAQTPAEVLAVNKRYVYTALEARGARSVIRTGGDLQAGPHLQAVMANAQGVLERVKGARKDG